MPQIKNLQRVFANLEQEVVEELNRCLRRP